LVPIDEDAITFPRLSTASSDEAVGEVSQVSPVFVNIVVLACVKKVVEAKTMVSFNHSGVVVL